MDADSGSLPASVTTALLYIDNAAKDVRVSSGMCVRMYVWMCVCACVCVCVCVNA